MHKAVDENGNTTYEFWVGNRKLTLYLDQGEWSRDISYIQVWGPSTDTEMDEGVISDSKSVVELLEWLYRVDDTD